MSPLLRKKFVSDHVVLAPLIIRKPGFIAGLLAIVLLVWIGRSQPTGGDDHQRYHHRTFTVVNIVDGDTLDINVPDGQYPHTRIRLWGVDTPEVAGSRDGAMHFGAEASAFAKHTLLNHRVEILLAPQRSRDKYNRLLAYVLLAESSESFSEMLIAGGYAYADWRFDHPYKKQYKQLERRARRQGAGLWAEVSLDQMPEWRQRMETDSFDSQN